MKKILTGFLGLFLVIGIVAGAGYALFSSTASITGMVLGTATPGLEIGIDKFRNDGQVDWMNTVPLYDLIGTESIFQPLLPGEMDRGEFWLRNISDTDNLELNLKGKISGTSGNWALLKDMIYIRICLFDPTPNLGEGHCDVNNTTGWKTLAQWEAGYINLPGSPLEQEVLPATSPTTADFGTKYAIGILLHGSADNTYIGKAVSINLEVVGEQAL